MSDSNEKVATMVAARQIVEASIPKSVQGAERRYQVLKRCYGNEVPDAALQACAMMIHNPFKEPGSA